MRKNQTIHPKALLDLEFDQILQDIAIYAKSESAKAQVLNILPHTDLDTITNALNVTNEYLISLESDNPLPHHHIKPFETALKKLTVENAFIEPKQLLNIAQGVDTIIKLHKFLNKFANYFPQLLTQIETLKFHPEIAKLIHQKIDGYGDIKDQASEELTRIRKQISTIYQDILHIFGQEKRQYDKLGYLADIKETVIEERNVLKAACSALLKPEVLFLLNLKLPANYKKNYSA